MNGMQGLLSVLGGGSAMGMQGLLTPEQQRAIQQQSMMAMAARLLQAGGPSTTPTSLGQALGGAFEAGQGAMQQGQTNAVQQMLLGQKLQEGKDARAQREAFNRMLGGGATTAPATAAGAMAAPTATAGRVGPTAQRAGMMTPTAQPTTQAQQVFAMLSPEQRALVQMLGPEAGAKELLGLTQAPTDVRAAEYILGQSLAGAGPQGIDLVGQYRSQIAPRTNVKTVLPPGPNQFVSSAGTIASGRLESSLNAAEAANATLRNIDIIAPALDTAVLGPAADYRTAMLRVGQQLGIAGENADQVLADTRQVVQGLARSELDAAAAMRGQGQITESERDLLRRTAAGDQTMTPAELRTSMAAMQKIANQRIKGFQELVETSRTIPGFEQIAPMFQITPYQSQFDLSRNLNLGNAVQQELQRRRTGGQ